MGIAARLRALRIRSGQSQGRMARHLGLNDAWYAELETRDAEFASTLSLFKAMEVASLLGVTLRDLFDLPPPAEPVALADLPQKILAWAQHEGISISQLENRLGLELQELVASPVQAIAALPLRCLQELAAALGMNWQALIPDDRPD